MNEVSHVNSRLVTASSELELMKQLKESIAQIESQTKKPTAKAPARSADHAVDMTRARDQLLAMYQELESLGEKYDMRPNQYQKYLELDIKRLNEQRSVLMRQLAETKGKLVLHDPRFKEMTQIYAQRQ